MLLIVGNLNLESEEKGIAGTMAKERMGKQNGEVSKYIRMAGSHFRGLRRRKARLVVKGTVWQTAKEEGSLLFSLEGSCLS